MKAAYNAVATRRKRKLAHTMVTDCSMKGQVAMQRALESANAVAGPGLTPRQELETAYHPSVRVSGVALSMGVSHPRYVRNAQACVAFSRLEAQCMLLESLAAKCKACRGPF